jgi:predicted RNase H-like HicB family nuclease
MITMKYGIVIETDELNCSAYVPDLPGCVATGKTVQETKDRIKEAIYLHLQGMREDGDAIPEPRTVCDFVEVA